MDSILTSIKKLLGIDESYTVFDEDLKIHINSVFSILNHLGVGPTEPFSISSSTETWDDFMEDATNIEMVKTFIYLKVRLIFDPPINGSVTNAINATLAELEWRLNGVADIEPNANTDEEEETDEEE